MKRYFFCFFAFLTAGSPLPAVADDPSVSLLKQFSEEAKDQEEIIKVFEDYKSAVLADNGPKAAKFVSSEIFQYFDKMKFAALNYDREKLQSELTVADQITVLRLRKELPAKKIKKLSGKALFINAINQQWLDKEYLPKVSLVNISAKNGVALADHMVDGYNTGAKVRFIYENRGWKFDPYALLAGSEVAFERGLPKDLEQRNQVITAAIESTIGSPIDLKLFEPSGKKKGKKKVSGKKRK